MDKVLVFGNLYITALIEYHHTSQMHVIILQY